MTTQASETNDGLDLKLSMIAHGVRQWQVAHALGCHESALSRMLRPGMAVSAEDARRIREAVARLAGVGVGHAAAV